MQRIKILTVIVFATLAVTPVLAQKTTPMQRFDQDYQQAMDLYRKAKYVAAQHQFDQLVQRQGNERGTKIADAVYYAAVCAQELGNGDAMYRMEEFLRLYPESSHANMVYLYQGNYHYNRAEYSLALQYYNKVEPSEIEYGHRDEYEYKCGYCQLNVGDREKAKKSFSHIMNGKSKYKTNALYYYAHIQYLEGDYSQAQKNFDRLINDKKTPSSLRKVAENYDVRIDYYLGNYDKFLQKAPALMRDEGVFKKDDLQQMMGEVYFNRGEYGEALKYYRLASAEVGGDKESKPQSCQQHDNAYQMGYCHYMLAQYDSAAVYLQRKTSCEDSVAQNALYTLGDTYVRLGRKSEARSMFLQASRMNFNAKIKEDALFNYAKLSCELNQNAYNESIKSFEDYLQKYPRTTHKSEIQEILTSLYFTTRNYKDALTLIEREKKEKGTLNAEMRLAYQRLLINRGIELFNGRNIQEASKYFAKAVQENADVQKTADACYLNGEAHYRLANYSQSKKALDKFFSNTKSKKSPYYSQALYTYGYLCVQSEHYAEGAARFSELVGRTDIDAQQRCDAYNRLGDCQYGQKLFEPAVASYTYVISHGGKDADYATYQKALACGALGRNEDKLTYLNHIFERYPQSQLASKARFEIGRTYLVWDNNEMSVVSFKRFIDDYPNSAYVKEALLNLGNIYYNMDNNNEALKYFDRLLRNYQGTDEARDALSTVQRIYTEQNRVDEYFVYAQEAAHVSVSSRVQDSVTYAAALDRYQESDFNTAISALGKYLDKYPNGLSSLDAHFYLAEAYAAKANVASSQSKDTVAMRQALDHYTVVTQRNKNHHTEAALAAAAAISMELADYQTALENYVQLVMLSEQDNSRLEARLGVLRCQNALGVTSNIVSAATELMNEAKVTTEMRDEAIVSVARAYYGEGQYDNAASYYGMLTTADNGAFYGEAVYRNAEILYLKHNIPAAEAAIDAIVNNPPSDYWLAKTFILWADIFYQQGNTLQAKQTLQSIIDNYDGQDLVDEATAKRNAIVRAEEAASAPQEQEDEIQLSIPLEDD